MKKFTNVVLIIALVCAVAGMVMCGIGVASGGTLDEIGTMIEEGYYSINRNSGWQDEDLRDRAKQSSEAFKNEEIRSLEADVDAGSLYILPSTDGDIHVEISSYNVKTEVRCDEGTLKIDAEGVQRWWRSGSRFCEITLYIPEGKAWDEVDISVGAGELDSQVSQLLANSVDISVDAGSASLMHEIIADQEVSLEVGAGELRLGQVQAAEMELDTGVGQMTLSADVSVKLSADCGVGEIDLTLKGVKEDYDYEIDCGIGEVRLGSETISSLGTTKRIDHNAGRQVQVDCGVGEVSISYEQ